MKPKRVLGAVLLAGLCASLAGATPQVAVDTAMNQSAFSLGEKQTAYLRVAMTGFALDQAERTPVNVTIVLDKSGSMSGQKLEQAKEAAIMALQRLRANDVVSVVVYDTTVNVLVPATKLSDKESIFDTIRSIEAGSSTALFAGVSRGADEVRKFLDRNRVNRIILLSDGLANVGPSAPSDLAQLGESLIREGISVTTIGLGLGFNEDLMTQLAMKSDGNHMFAEMPQDLAKSFDAEFGDVLTVVAQDVDVAIDFAEGVRPVRGLGREVSIAGQRATIKLNQLYENQMKYVLVEVELPPYTSEALLRSSLTPIASVDVSYANMSTKTTDRIRRDVGVQVAANPDQAKETVNKDVMASVVEQIGVERNTLAQRMRDEGKIDEARSLLLENDRYLSSFGRQLRNDRLTEQSIQNRMDAENLAPEKWEYRRKLMKQQQYVIEKQQAAK